MIIDMHAHPWLMNEAFKTSQAIEISKKEMGWGLMSGHANDQNRT